MTDKQIAVKVDHVSKYFKLPTEATNSLRTALILGRNGSGKSTLLKIISEIYVPEKGTVTIDGKLVSFIELGVGFNPELTGRENVYMNGAMLGFSTAEIDAMYDDIVDFAELHDFMNQKLKNYSSGMQVRLAFSVAIKAQGDILILDEVLAVGDEAFQRKCNDYFQERKKSGKTTILVTHDMGAVKKYCNKAFDVSDQYSFDNLESNSHHNGNEDEGLVTTKVEGFTAILLSPKKVTPDDEVVIEFSFDLLDDSVNPHIAFSFIDISTGNGLYNDNSMDIPLSGVGPKKITYKCKLPYFNHVKLRLVAFLRDENQENLAILSTTNPPVFSIDRVVDRTNRSELDSSTGLLVRQGKWE